MGRNRFLLEVWLLFLTLSRGAALVPGEFASPDMGMDGPNDYFSGRRKVNALGYCSAGSIMTG